MENVTQETILYKIEARIAEAKEEKIKLLGEHKEDNNLNAKSSYYPFQAGYQIHSKVSRYMNHHH